MNWFLSHCPVNLSNMSTHRQCTINLHNKTTNYRMQDPLVYIVSGTSSEPPPPPPPPRPALDPSESGSALFIKTAYTACGSLAVFTYDLVEIFSMQFLGRVAVMFSVPYDFNFHSNWYGVGMFRKDIPCDANLFNLMYEEEETTFVRGRASGSSLVYRGNDVTIRATMSDSYQPVLKVEVCDN
ncbi:DELTA-sagatoxin-Srs1a-like [Melanotaenia boesemani]|uniref:DELTA-sagatoxin-Srs1a-like n=1 Tax=Melanotaenia boesemani TaxID=1250792 RepID=UPI001C05917D|nr:DELTA-sagatoxin-Srs1a-like [Melanotaenia boesemani]